MDKRLINVKYELQHYASGSYTTIKTAYNWWESLWFSLGSDNADYRIINEFGYIIVQGCNCSDRKESLEDEDNDCVITNDPSLLKEEKFYWNFNLKGS